MGAIAAALLLAGCNEPKETSSGDGPPDAAVPGENAMIAANNAEGAAAAPGGNAAATVTDRPAQAAALPREDAAVIAELFAGLAETERLVDGTAWTSGVVGATGTILEAAAVDGTGCMRFRSSMDGSLGSMLLAGVACERLGGWSVDELAAEGSTG